MHPFVHLFEEYFNINFFTSILPLNFYCVSMFSYIKNVNKTSINVFFRITNDTIFKKIFTIQYVITQKYLFWLITHHSLHHSFFFLFKVFFLVFFLFICVSISLQVCICPKCIHCPWMLNETIKHWRNGVRVTC